MNKALLIEQIAKDAEISKAAAERALNAFQDALTVTLKSGGSLMLVGFGSFSVKQRAERTGRNPQTGESIKIPASKAVVFKAGSNLKDTINN